MQDDVATRIARARSWIGTPFHLQGRDRDGVDCVGLIAVVHGLTEAVPDNYTLRGFDRTSAMALLDQHFVRRDRARPLAGDVLLILPGLAQLHLGIWSGTGLVHAHAGLRRVVETPGPLTQPTAGIWHQETN